MASDGNALEVLREAFPGLKSYELPGYNIRYTKSSWSLKFQLLFAIPKVWKAMKAERKCVQGIIAKEDIKGIISDNRFGVYHPEIPSVFITHQLTVLSGWLTAITTKIHKQFIERFDECWVPDLNKSPNLSGRLSLNNSIEIPVKRIGVLSRLTPKTTNFNYDLVIVLSGPEPQRSLLETQLLKDFPVDFGRSVLVRGVLSETTLDVNNKNLEVINYANTTELNELLNSSKLVLARSGYSTIMDLLVLGKKAFFIPTPGQNEQEYLAKRMDELQIAPFAKQHDFNFKKLKEVSNYRGFSQQKVSLDLKLFSLFQGE